MAEQPMQLTESHSTSNGLSASFSTSESQTITENMFSHISQDMINQAFLNQQLASQQELNDLLSGSTVLPQNMMLIDTPTLPSQELLTQSKALINADKMENLISSGESTPTGGLTPQEQATSMLHLPPHGNFCSESSNLAIGSDMMSTISSEQQFLENMLAGANTRNVMSRTQNISVPVSLPIDPPHSVPSMTTVHSNTNVHMNNIFPNNMMSFDMCSTQVPLRKHGTRVNRPAHLRHGYSKSVSMFTPPNKARSSNSYYCANNMQSIANQHFIQTMPSEHIPPSFQKQMVENSQVLHSMRKKMGHRRQYSAPELKYSGFPRSPEKQLLRQTTEGQMLKQRAYMHMPPANQIPPNDFHGIIPEHMEALTLQSQGDPGMKPLKIFEYNVNGYGTARVNNSNALDSTQGHKYEGSATLFKAGSVDDLSINGKSKSLDNLTREELIRRLRNVEDELAKTKSSPNMNIEMPLNPLGDTESEQGDEVGTIDLLDSTSVNALISHKSDEKREEEEDEEEEPDEDYIKSDRDDDKFERSQSFDCLWSDCSKSFPALDLLISHIGQQHIGSGKASYKCEWQGCSRNQKPFTKRHKMYNHLRTHTGERPFQCPVADCGKRFSRPDSLATHVKTHSNVRPYLCPVPGCGKAYYHSRSLRKHVKGHEMSHSFEAYPQNIPGPNPQQISDFNNQLLGAAQLTQRIKYHHYQPDSSTFTTQKSTNDSLSMNNTQVPTSTGGGSSLSTPPKAGGKVALSQDYPGPQINAPKQEASMIEPPVLQSHQFPNDDTMGLLTSNAISSSSITTEMLDRLIRQVTPPTSQAHLSNLEGEEPGLSLFISSVRFPQVASIASTTQTH